MVILLFGPPGCGKGTQAPLLRESLGVPAISTGDMLRREIAAGTETGRIADGLLAAGKLVPTQIVNQLLEDRLAEDDCRDGFLIDGYPRTEQQAMHLTELIDRLGHPKPLLLHLDVPERVLVGRLSARWICPLCNRVYNMLTRAPHHPGRCDADDTALIQRPDDTIETAYRRLEAYRQLTDPVLAFFALSGAGNVVHINGHQDPAAVFDNIRHVLEQYAPVRVSVLKRS